MERELTEVIDTLNRAFALLEGHASGEVFGTYDKKRRKYMWADIMNMIATAFLKKGNLIAMIPGKMKLGTRKCQ